MRKLLIISCAILLVASLLGCDQHSPKNQVEKHYDQLVPLVVKARKDLDNLYGIPDKLICPINQTEYINKLKQNFTLQQDALKNVNVPDSFGNEWSLAQQWFSQGPQMFDISADIEIEENLAALEKLRDNFYAAKYKELDLYNQFTNAYNAKMTALGFGEYNWWREWHYYKGWRDFN